MKTIDEIQAELRALAQELEQLKKQEQGDAEQLDFVKLSSMGERYPVNPHPLVHCDEHTMKHYLIMLLSITQYAGEQLEETLLLAHRIAFGMGYLRRGEHLKEEYLAAQTLSFDDLDECTGLFQGSDNSLMLILELLLMAGTFEYGRRDALEYISRLCVMLKVDSTEVVFLGNMAAVILTKDLGQYRCNIRNWYTIFDGYLKDIEFNREIYYLPTEKIDLAKTAENFFSGFGGVGNVLMPLTEIRIKEASYKCIYKGRYSTRDKTSQGVFRANEGCALHVFFAETIRGHVSRDILGIARDDVEHFYENNEDDMRKWNKAKQVLKKKLHKPIGVQTHPLDSEALARDFFERQKGK